MLRVLSGLRAEDRSGLRAELRSGLRLERLRALERSERAVRAVLFSSSGSGRSQELRPSK